MLLAETKWTAQQPRWAMIGFLSLLMSGMVLQVSAGSHVFMGKFYPGPTTRQNYIAKQFSNVHKQFINTDSLPETQCENDPNTKIAVEYFDQPLDQFGTSGNTAWWKQHYQVNDKFFNPSVENPAVFLLIGGEGPISKRWVCVEEYTYMKLAAKHKARVIQLEHRFFGSNKGFKDLSVESLQYLTTEQALADLNRFIIEYSKLQQWSAPKWVIFGGSYPGTMAALFRLLYPNSSQGAVSSSSVLFPKVDLWEYAQQMEVVINATKVNKEGDCYTEFKQGFDELAKSLVSEQGRTQASRLLNLKTPLTNNLDDIQTVQFKIFDALQGIIQYTYDNRVPQNQNGKTWNIQHACELMVNSNKQRIERLGDIYTLGHEGDDDTDKRLDPVYKNLIAPWQDTSIGADSYRGWMWLSCNEFGWLQSTSNNGMFGNAVPIGYLYKMCSDLFDGKLNATLINQHVQSSLDRYGYPWEFRVTNTIFPAGGFDPWSVLRVNTTDEKTHMISHLTPGSAHCSDMYPPYDKEPSGLKETRDLVGKEVDFYMSLPSSLGKQASTSTQKPNIDTSKKPNVDSSTKKANNFVATNSQISFSLLSFLLFVWQLLWVN